MEIVSRSTKTIKQTPGIAPGIRGLQPLALLLGYACINQRKKREFLKIIVKVNKDKKRSNFYEEFFQVILDYKSHPKLKLLRK